MAEPFRILTLNTISPLGLKRFASGSYTVGGQVPDPDAILVRSQDMHQMEIARNVKAVGRAGAGTNNIPVTALSRRGVPVFNAPGANANAVKELVIAAMLMAARNLIPAMTFAATLKGDDATLHKLVEDGKKHFVGTELPKHTLGIIGLGKIGSLVADAAIKLGMNVMGFDPHITVDAAWSLPSQVRKAHSVEEVLKGSDYVTLHAPLVDLTRHMINTERLKLVKHGAILLNFARDGLVDEVAVMEALAERRLRYYMCDFPTQRLQGRPHVVALPHLGASTREAEDNCAVMVVDQVRDFLEHGNIIHAVNFPEVVMGREAPFRVGIANANVPNMVGQISTAMARAGLNIHNMLNKSRGDMAYTLVDADSAVPQTLLAELAGIKGVLSVRYLPQE
ncbi:MAG: D-3-phosphoglycerate dehydrogenase / 2-oxoglutarate reductase [Betaproteobacteria bacterium]|jgi:D-3-phosphoglycerate dehydrogenase|nr:D-3-phosphoglycerate dehydrogenase / 2-oxoglutarate reductase [Betaproteobacteria bacterium]